MMKDTGNIDLPNAIDLEAQVLGTLMTDNSAIEIVAPLLRSGHLFEEAHQIIYQTIIDTTNQGIDATPPALIPYLPKEKIGSRTFPEYLARMTSAAVPKRMVRGCTMTVIDMAQRRQLLSLAAEITQDAGTVKGSRLASVIASDAEEKLTEIKSAAAVQEGSGTAKRAALNLIKMEHESVRRPVIRCNIEEVHYAINGDFEAGNLYGLLSASGEGKTSMSLQIIGSVAEQGHPCLVMSYDQTAEQSLRQMASQITGLDGTLLRDGNMDRAARDQYLTTLEELSRLPIVFKRCAKQEGTAQLGGYARQFMRSFAGGPTPMVMLDHTRKVTPKDPRAHEGRIASEVNGWAKAMAGELEAVWLNIVQRSTAGLSRDNPRPVSRDLYGGEQSKEDFDGIFYVYRPDKYKEDQIRIASTDKAREAIEDRFRGWEGLAEIGAIKVRYGSNTRSKKMKFIAHCTKYETLRKYSHENSMSLF